MAAARRSVNTFAFREKTKKKRPGVHAKSKTSKLKSSKNYSKKYRGQGR
tara:strand:+ start:130 stop:276 length:147 start_codon:yes stop_codon:yes gene_type:complete